LALGEHASRTPRLSAIGVIVLQNYFRAQSAKYSFTDKHKRASLIQNTDEPDSIMARSQCSIEFCNTIGA
jgi:hypothetical protein